MREQPSVQTAHKSATHPINQETNPKNISREFQKKSKNWLIVIFILLFLGASGVVGYFAYQNFLMKKNITEIKPSSSSEYETSSIKPISSPASTFDLESEIVSIDDNWNKYTNFNLGFSINIPKEIGCVYGSCKWDIDSYRPDPKMVPVKIFEDDNTVYIANEYFYKLSGETEEDGLHLYSNCDKVINSISVIKDDSVGFYQQKWEIIAGVVADDKELDEFISKHYGQGGCKSGERSPDKQEGVFNVYLNRDELVSIEEVSKGGCLVNYEYVIKYFPNKNMVVTWKIGQAYSFSRNLDLNIFYDKEMIDSFRFIDNYSNTRKEGNDSIEYYTGEISPVVPYEGLKFREINIHNFVSLDEELNNTDFHYEDAVIDGYTFVANEGEDFEFIAKEDRDSNPGSFIKTELYGWGPTVVKMDTTIGWGVPVTGRYFYVVKGENFYGENLDKPYSKYGKYLLQITQRK